MNPTSAPAPRRRRLLWLGVAALLVGAYALLGFLLAPRLLQQAIEERGTAALHREVRVAAVQVNPFTLGVTIEGLLVKGKDAPRLAGWEALHLRLAPWKVLGGDLGVAELRLVRPFGRLALDPAGRLNLQDLLDGDPAPPAAPAPAGARPALGVALDLLEIVEAELAFEDATRAPAFRTTLGPLSVRLTDFRTRGGGESPYTFSGATEAGERFSWTGTVHSEPLRSSGTISFGGVTLPKYGAYLRDAFPELLLEAGAASLDARYRLEWSAEGRVAALSGLGLTVEGLALARRRDGARALELPRVEVRGVEADLLGRTASVAEVRVTGGRLVARREADGRLLPLELLATPPGAGAPGTGPGGATPPPAAPGGPPRPAAAPAPWRWTLATFDLSGAAVTAEDLSAPAPVRLELTEVAVKLTGLSGRADGACPITASLRWGAGGTATARGTLWPFQQKADLAVDATGLDLVPLAPLLDGAAPLRLAEGRLDLSTRLSFDGAGPSPAWSVRGDVRLLGLSLRHRTRGEELVRWRALELLGLDVASTGRRLALRTVRLTEPSLRAIVFEDGTTSAAAQPGATAAAARGAPTPGPGPTAAPATAPGGAADPAWRTAIGLLQVVGGKAAFVDRSITPPVLLALTDVEARVAQLSSDPRVRSTVEVRAKVNGAAPVTVTGTLNPLQAAASTELAVTARGVDLTPLDGYAGRQLGYGLQKGKLDLDLTYKVEDGALLAGNLVRLDQLTLGEATGSPDATAIPVRLALALLRDQDGVILLDVPVEGRLDDPEFRFGRVIWRTVLNVLVKVATSPFSALASLVAGGKEDISLVEFAPGDATLDEAARRRVELLARSLGQRPALGLELEGTADPEADTAALRRAGLELRLRRAKGASLRPPVAPEAVIVTPEERPLLVEAAFHLAFPPPPVAPPVKGQPPEPAPTPAAMEVRLLDAEAVAPEALVALAAARASAAREAVLAAGLDAARLFAVEGGERARKEAGARAYFTVR